MRQRLALRKAPAVDAPPLRALSWFDETQRQARARGQTPLRDAALAEARRATARL